MALAPGTILGAYEVVALVGVGGMGEVYRARDARLDRDVAIKILPPHLAQDRNAIARFKREAKMASALNHPHILHIYEIGEAQTDSGTNHYIAMEFVEGLTLRAHLKLGTPGNGLIAPLVQVADALARAHRAGIVHRDLKPENIYPKRSPAMEPGWEGDLSLGPRGHLETTPRRWHVGTCDAFQGEETRQSVFRRGTHKAIH